MTSANLWRRHSCAFFILHAGLWVRRAPDIPCALFFGAHDSFHDSDANRVAGMRWCVSVIARSVSSEAIHSFFARRNGLLRCARNDDRWLFEI